jgi:tetratricopeptide (TPR) repeat protein
MACLDRARASMRALVGALADGRLDDPDLRARTGELPPLAACADDEALDGADRRPPAVDEVRLQEAMNLMFDARLAVYDIVRADATTRSERALAAARATAWAPLVSDAALVHGELLRLRERYDEARPFYDEALREALRGGPTSAQAEIMASLSYLEILRGRPDEAQAWIDRAMALLLRLHRPRELDLLVLDDAFAIALATGDLARARAYAEREVALASDPAHLDHRRLAEALLDVARLAVAEGRYADAVATVERAMAIGQEVLGPDAPWLAIPLELELEPLIALGRTREAKAAVERAIAVRAPVFGADDPLAGNLYAMLGAVAQRHGDLVAARAAFADALPRAIATHGKDSTTAAMAIANLAMVDAEAGDHARAEESALAAQRIFERQLGADAAELVNVLIIRAYAARGQGRLADARGHLERGHRIALATRGAGHPETANLEVELAHTDRLAGRRPAAIARYRAVLARAGELPPPMIAEAGFGLAQAAWAEGARADARIAGDDARNTYLLLGDDFAGKRAEVEAWLAAHPAPP